jgi:phenylpyruvate tautomerase PptA (4-oxalocrotonate tautomerase family)
MSSIGVPREATWVLINDHPAGNWAQGGKLLSEK